MQMLLSIPFVFVASLVLCGVFLYPNEVFYNRTEKSLLEVVIAHMLLAAAALGFSMVTTFAYLVILSGIL